MNCELKMSATSSLQKMANWDPQRIPFDPQYNDSLYSLQNVNHLGMLDPSDAPCNALHKPCASSSLSSDYYYQENDIVASAFSTATSSQLSCDPHPKYDSFPSASTPEEYPTRYQYNLSTSPVSSVSNEDSNFNFSNQSFPPENYQEVNNENNSVYTEYQLRHPSTYDMHTSSNLLRHNDLDIDSDDLFRLDSDSAFYDLDLVDDFGSDITSLDQCYSSSEANGEKSQQGERKNYKSRCGRQYKKRNAANQRERKRMQVINNGFEKLRKHLPYVAYEKKLSKVDTLKSAIDYISFMTKILKAGTDGENQKPKKKVVVYYRNKVGDNVTENDVIGHSLSWSWEENELSWSPTTSSENSESKDERNNERASEISFRQNECKQKRKRVRAKTWSPKFPGDKTADKSPSKKNETNLIVRDIYSTSLIDFNDEKQPTYLNPTSHTDSVSHFHIPLDEYLPATPSTTSESFEDFSAFPDYSLPPVASLFGSQTESESLPTNASLGEINHFVNDVITPESTNDYSFQTTLDAFLWNPKDILSPPQPSNCSNVSLSVK